MTGNGTTRPDDASIDDDESTPMVRLGGGVANAGAVFRRGSVVLRPAGPHSEAVQSLMRRWRQAGIDEVPEPLGFESAPEPGGRREVLRFVPGRVAAPDEEWAATGDTLVAVASIQRRLHDAAATFRSLDASESWGAKGYIPEAFLPPTAPSVIACHNDLCVTNIVFAPDRLAVAAVIDWDYAQPVDRLFDVAVAMRHWVPFADHADRAPAWADADAPTRFRAWADVMALSLADRQRALDIAIVFLDQAHVNVANLARNGVGGFADLIRDGYLDRNRRDRQWIVDNHAQLTASP